MNYNQTFRVLRRVHLISGVYALLCGLERPALALCRWIGGFGSMLLVVQLTACLSPPVPTAGQDVVLGGRVLRTECGPGVPGVRVDVFRMGPPPADFDGRDPRHYVHERILSTVTGDAGVFMLNYDDFPALGDCVKDIEFSILVWSEVEMGYFNSWYDLDDFSDSEYVDHQSIRIRLSPRSRELTVRAQNSKAMPISGVKLLCQPWWNSWGFARIVPGRDADEWTEVLDELGLLGETDSSGICVFSKIPLLDEGLDEDDTAFTVVPGDSTHIVLTNWFDGLPEEPRAEKLLVERVRDIVICGTVRGPDGKVPPGTVIWVNDTHRVVPEAGGYWSVSGLSIGPLPWELRFEAPGFETQEGFASANYYLREVVNGELEWDIVLPKL